MHVTHIKIQHFKALREIDIPLGRINLLVGGNNSGKSCVLQAVHFAVSLTQSARAQKAANFSPENLRYLPAQNFIDLKHGRPLSEAGDPISVTFSAREEDQTHEFEVTLKRGRNSTISTVSIEKLDSSDLGKNLADADHPFSIYVPGLAGIPSREEYRTKLVMDRGAARGDANLFLRNVLLRLFKDLQKKAVFEERLNIIFPGLSLIAGEFKEEQHVDIPVRYSRDGVERSIEMLGTGALQAIQILSYVTYYRPTLLLLDEPDAHLHANNQRKLVESLLLLTEEESVQVLLATHSRHLVQEFHSNPDCRLFRLQDGALRDSDSPLVDTLMDIGALDRFDNIELAGMDWLVLTEDKLASTETLHPLKILLAANGFNLTRCKIISYDGCTNWRTAMLLAQFVSEHHSHMRILVHLDRDFLSDNEIEKIIKTKFGNVKNVNLFITEESDIEGYFVRPEHVAYICGVEIEMASEWIEKAARDNHNSLVTRFNGKRDALHKHYSKSSSGTLEKSCNILSNDIPLPKHQRVGKDMLKYLLEIEGSLSDEVLQIFKDSYLSTSPSLESNDLKKLCS